MKICPRCKAEYDDKYNYCHYCESKLVIKNEQKENTQFSQVSNCKIGMNKNGINKSDSKEWTIIVCCFVILALLGFFALNGNFVKGSNIQKSSNTQHKKTFTETKENISYQNNQTFDELSKEKDVFVSKVKKQIPKGFKPVSVLSKVMYVPKEFDSIDTSYQISAQDTNAGIALTGTVLRKEADVKNPLAKFYDIAVFYEKNELLLKMKPYEEVEVLEAIFKNAQETMNPKTFVKDKIISQKLCKNVDGHWYLKAIISLKSKKGSKYDEIEHLAIYIIGDTIYFISSSPNASAGDIYDKEIDTIFDTFNCDLK